MPPEKDTAAGVVLTDLAALPEQAMVDEEWLANAFKVSPRTIRRMVQAHQLPPPIRVGNKSLWIVGRVLDFLDSVAQSAEREAKRHREKQDLLKPS